MSLFHALVRAHRHASHERHGRHVGGHHGGHHGHPGHHHFHHGRFDGDAADLVELLADRISQRLDLNDEQEARLARLLAAAQQQRQALRRDGLVPELRDLLAGATLDREATRLLLSERIAAVQAAAPALIDALADFFDALDAEQQQVLRFMLRLKRRGWGRAGRGDRSDRGERGGNATETQ
ncbi:MAG TPA: Spy/CpxP family protein refolding chaperone [Candidatus Aquabacterium excrementipullorum]|nr:Spy/CpxP family protein refolding chaperone [Candidatus Aquabacterium excrementipullorum]